MLKLGKLISHYVPSYTVYIRNATAWIRKCQVLLFLCGWYRCLLYECNFWLTDAIKLQTLELYFSDVLMINININNAFMTASLYLITLMQTSETEEQVRKGPRHAHYDMAFRTCATHTRNLWKEVIRELKHQWQQKTIGFMTKTTGCTSCFLVHLFDVHCMKTMLTIWCNVLRRTWTYDRCDKEFSFDSL